MNQDLSKKPLLAGVIGNPIIHSKSPVLHNYWLKRYSINGYYIPIHVELNNLEKSIHSLIALGFRGVNITIPYKSAILSIADIITDRASIIGAANTLYFSSQGQITADNTDGYGFKKNVYHYYPSWKPKDGHAVVFGAGGAAKAIVHTLLSEGVPIVKLVNRTKVKAEVLADNFGNKVEVYDWFSKESVIENANTIVNTTSLGMLGHSDFVLNFDGLNKKALVTDLVYNPVNTVFLKTAKRDGYATVDGLGMLLFQAEIGFKNWFDLSPEINDDLKVFMLKNIMEKW